MRVERVHVSMDIKPAKWAFAGFVIFTLHLIFCAAIDAQESKSRQSDSTGSVGLKTSPTKELRFLSYNLRNYLPMRRKVDGASVEDAPKPEDEIAALIKVVVSAKPDIIGVCEIGGPSFVKDFQRRLKEAGIEMPYSELVEASTDYERNLALLSRFPIVARHPRVDLTYLIGDKRLPFQRGILDVTVAPNPQYRLRLIGLHLKSKREVYEADQAMMRRNEAQLARKHIDAILEEEPGANLIVYGDLNGTKNETPVRALRGIYRSDAYLTAINVEDQYGFRWTHYWNYADSYARFDFVMASQGMRSEIDKKKSYIPHNADWYLASDHRPLVVTILAKDSRR